MALMIPDYIHADCKSNAERKLFERFKTELPRTYTILHSLGIAKHFGKLKGEIDFVVISQKGILCIEVKGGRIKQERGIWFFINRYDEVSKKKESPFEQSVNGMYALRKRIEKKFGWNSPQFQSVIGYCVIFPSQTFSVQSPEWDLNRLIDEKSILEPMGKLIERQLDYSEKEILRVSGKLKCLPMSKSQVGELLYYLRPDFECVPSLSSRINEYQNSLLRLTEEQYSVLDQLDLNDRIVIDGGAGTGKTLLAVEKARREASKGKKTLLVCYNNLIAKHCRLVLSKENYDNLIVVNNLHAYAKKIICDAGMESLLPEQFSDKFFKKEYPELFGQAVLEVFENPPFDTLIVDEGQDLLFDSYLTMLDWILTGGMKNGRWIWFEDQQQNIFLSEKIQQSIDLSKFKPVICKLSVNCRNTKPISVFNSLTTSTKGQKCIIDSDIRVSTDFYRSNKHQIKILDNSLKRIIREGVHPSDIVILSPFTLNNSALKGIEKIAGVNIREYDVKKPLQEKSLQFSTIQRFKGLEAKVVIIIDLSELIEKNARRINYVAFSRAISYLKVLIHENAKSQYDELAYNFGMHRIDLDVLNRS
jgi:Nuclease-related domain/UvrD-like helicase C-terminal domain